MNKHPGQPVAASIAREQYFAQARIFNAMVLDKRFAPTDEEITILRDVYFGDKTDITKVTQLLKSAFASLKIEP